MKRQTAIKRFMMKSSHSAPYCEPGEVGTKQVAAGHTKIETTAPYLRELKQADHVAISRANEL